jgi:metal-responsive CopG/Arc/MetJ family transcriptional regulator
VRLPAELIKAVDAWAARNKAATRSAAIRTMIETALKSAW